MTEAVCYNCKSIESSLYDQENGYNLVKCDDCGLLYVNPRPPLEEINAASKSGMHRGDELLDVTGSFERRLKNMYLGRLDDLGFSTLSNGPRTIDWLDIGCGHGEFIDALEQMGRDAIQVTGLEPNQQKREGAVKRGLDVQFFNVAEHEHTYDVISALNVYSHLPNPVEDIGQWCGMLNEGGELLLQTGDSAHLPAKDHHKPYSLPDHLSFTSQDILVPCLERLDLEVLEIKKYRMGQYPRFTPISILKEFARAVLPSHTSSFQFFPNHPDRDMWIRARKKS